MPDWWWPGFLLEFAIFMASLLLFVWWFARWSTRHVDKHLDEMDELRLRQDELRRQQEEG